MASTSLFSPNNSSVQSLFDLFIASVIQSEYSTIISPGSTFISTSFNIFEISFTIHKATQPDFTLNVLLSLCL